MILLAVLNLSNNNLLAQDYRVIAKEFFDQKSIALPTNFDSVEFYLLQIYETALLESNEKEIVRILDCLGLLNAAKPDFVASIKWYSKLLNGSYQMSNTDSFDIFYHSRDVYLKIKAYDKALETHLLLKPFYKRIKDNVRRIDYLTVIAKIYLGLGNYNRAIESYRNCAALARDFGYSHLNAMMYNDIGICFERQLKPDSALFYFNMAVEILKEQVLTKSTELYDSFSLALIEGNIAQVLFKQKNVFDGVEKALLKDLSFSKRLPDIENAIHTYNHLAQFYLSVKNFDKALLNANTAIYLSNKIDVELNNVISYKTKGAVFLKLKDHDSAAFCYLKAMNLSDSLSLEKSNIQIASMEAVYALEDKEERLKKQIQINKAAASELDRRLSQNQKILTVVFVLAVSLILLYYAYYRRRIREQKLTLVYNEIEKQKAIIENTLAEKESLLKEIHHRVKNNLQVISSLLELQSFRTSNKEIKKAIIEGQNRVKSMALIHQKLYQTEELKDLPFAGYIEDLTRTLIQSYGNTEAEIDVQINCDQVSLHIDFAIPMGLITNELISNSLKYAFSGIKKPIITIVLRELAQGNYLFKVSDNGIGLPPDFNIEKLDSLGVKLIKTLAKQIGADWSLTGADGTVFIMKFKC